MCMQPMVISLLVYAMCAKMQLAVRDQPRGLSRTPMCLTAQW
jgi:hypothetical protein